MGPRSVGNHFNQLRPRPVLIKCHSNIYSATLRSAIASGSVIYVDDRNGHDHLRRFGTAGITKQRRVMNVAHIRRPWRCSCHSLSACRRAANPTRSPAFIAVANSATLPSVRCCSGKTDAAVTACPRRCRSCQRSRAGTGTEATGCGVKEGIKPGRGGGKRHSLTSC